MTHPKDLLYSTHGFINFTIYTLNFRHIRHSCFLFKGLLDKEASFLCFTWIVRPSHTCSDTLRDSLRDGNSFEGWVFKQDLVNQLSGSISSEDTEFFYVYIHTVYAEYVYIYSVCVNTWKNMYIYLCNSCVCTLKIYIHICIHVSFTLSWPFPFTPFENISPLVGWRNHDVVPTLGPWPQRKISPMERMGFF